MTTDSTPSIQNARFCRSFNELTPAEQREVRRLQRLDQEVRLHEQIHAKRAMGFVRSAPSYTYEVGPDGKSYAVNGQVTVDGGAPMTPEDAIAKARLLGLAACAPGDPSLQDSMAAMNAYAYVRTAKEVIMNRSGPSNLSTDPDVAAQQAELLRRYSYDPLNPYILAWV
jgi:hypothetical protein